MYFLIVSDVGLNALDIFPVYVLGEMERLQHRLFESEGRVSMVQRHELRTVEKNRLK